MTIVHVFDDVEHVFEIVEAPENESEASDDQNVLAEE